MRISFTFKIAIGFFILLITMLSMYAVNIYTQFNYANFQHDYDLFLEFSKKTIDFNHEHTTFVMDYDSATHKRLVDIENDLSADIIKLDKRKNLGNQELNTALNNVDLDIKLFKQGMFKQYLSRIKLFGLQKMLTTNDKLSELDVEKKTKLISEGRYLLEKSRSINQNLEKIFVILNKQKENMDNLRNITTNIFSLIGIIVSTIVSIIILMQVRRSLFRLTVFVRRIAEGDFTATIDIRTGDEIQVLAENVQNIVSFQNILIQIKNSEKTLAKTYSKIKEATDAVYDSINTQAQTAVQATTSFELLTTAINEIANTSLKTNVIALETKKNIHESSEQIRDTIADIDVLSKLASKIMGILNIINAITEQTELLSLNASIEAARAGEKGKGFAVVASEIRKLSETSTDATKEISQLAREIIKTIKITKSKSEVSIEALQTIESSISGVVKLIEEIAKATESESHGSKQIMEAVSYVSELSRKNSDNADKIVTNNMSLKTEVEQLHKLVNQFKISKEAAALVRKP